MFESLTFVFKVLIAIVMFLSLMKVIKYLATPKDWTMKGPQLLVCTRSKTLSTFHVFTFGKKNLNCCPLKHISQVRHYVSRSLGIPKALSLFLKQCRPSTFI